MKRALNRRHFIAGAAAVGAAGVTLSFVMAEEPPGVGSTLTPPEALEQIRAGQLVMVDVRRPDEWARTGVAEGAVPIDMRRADFVEAVQAAMAARPGAPVAFICAAGVRSRRVTNTMAQAGITNIVDVPEGMMGSKAGPGWLARGLPITHVKS